MIARIVVRGRPNGSPATARKLISSAIKKLPNKTKFLITPGGFVCGKFPKQYRRTGWGSYAECQDALFIAASATLNKVLTPKILAMAKNKADVITLCVDLREKETREHAELIAVFDVASSEVVGWSGKTYPTYSQENTLAHMPFHSHLINVADERVLILGCHDLNMWNPRGWANQQAGSMRRTYCAEMRKQADKFKPTVVLQHPHDTDSPNIWTLGWAGIRKRFPKLKAWASAICYNNENGGKQRAPLEDVLRRTKSDLVVDVIAN